MITIRGKTEGPPLLMDEVRNALGDLKTSKVAETTSPQNIFFGSSFVIKII